MIYDIVPCKNKNYVIVDVYENTAHKAMADSAISYFDKQVAKNLSFKAAIYTNYEMLYYEIMDLTDRYPTSLLEIISWLTDNVGLENYKIVQPIEYLKLRRNHGIVLIHIDEKFVEEILYVRMKWTN